MLMLWGPRRVILYNDAFSQIAESNAVHATLFGGCFPESWPDSWPVIMPVISSVIAGQESVLLENQSFLRDCLEANRWTLSLGAVNDDFGAVGGVLLSCLQEAKTNVAASQLRISEQRFQNLIRDASVGIIMLHGANKRVEIVNDAYASLIGRNADELRGKNLFEIIPEAQDPFSSYIDQVRQTGQPIYLYAQPYFVMTKNGRKDGFLDLIYQPYTELDGTITGVIVLCQDVSQQVFTRRQLEESEARLRSVVDSAPFPIGVYVGPDMRIQLLNKSIIDVWGKGADIIGKRYAEVLPELAGKGIYEQLDNVYRTGQPYYAHNQRVDLVVAGQLQRFYFKYTFTPLFDAGGNVYGVMNTAADVTDLVLAQEQLLQAQTSLMGAVELAQLGSWELDLGTNEVTYSDNIKWWFGLGQDHAALEQIFNPIHPDDRQIVEEAIAEALRPGSSGIYDAEYRLVGKGTDGERVVHALGKVFFNAEGIASKLIGTAQDVTQVRQRQQVLEALVQERTADLEALNEELAAQNEEYLAVNDELEEANQLLMRSNENLEQFAYVAGHDLQEPLRKIRQFGDLLKNRFADATGKDLLYIDRIQAAAARMSVLITDLLDFASLTSQRQQDQPVALDSIIEAVLIDLELVIVDTGAKVQINSLPTVQGNALQLAQLFQNLISNALKFRKADVAPVISITNGLVTHAQLPAWVKPVRSSPMYYQVRVTDNGIGFDEIYLDRIFQVFQRLHGRQEYVGTGIGLAICKKVVASHGGAITANSQPGQGSTFTIYFPVLDDEA